MSPAERITIIEQIWDSIEPTEIGLTHEQEQELDYRLNRYEKDETVFHKWEDIKKELNASK